MDPELLERLDRQDKELAAIRLGVDKIRNRLFWGSVASTLLFLLPLIGLAALIPWLIDTLSSSVSALSDIR